MPYTYNIFSNTLDFFKATSGAGLSPSIENKRGSNCNGSDGATNRVLTLANTSMSSKESVYVNGVRLTATTDYTISHLSSSSTITFLGNIFNADYISAQYFT